MRDPHYLFPFNSHHVATQFFPPSKASVLIQKKNMCTTPMRGLGYTDLVKQHRRQTWVEKTDILSSSWHLQQGNEEERREHDMLAKGVHLLLLLQHIKQLKASLYAAGSVVNSCLTDAKFLKGIVFSLQFQGVLEKFSRLPMYEEEASRQAQWREKAVALLDTKLRVFENIASVLSKEMDASRQKIVASRRQKGLDQDTIRGLELKVNACRCQACRGGQMLHT